MHVLTGATSLVLWKEVVRNAENRCAVALKDELESYLISLLMRFTNQPEIARQVLATAFLEALQSQKTERVVSLQHVGDQCLLFAGLFPRLAEKKHVKIGYFVDLGKSAYSAVSKQTDDLYGKLALQFVVLMDVLQSIRPNHDLLPLEAYEQWQEVGSDRALRILKEYTEGMPLKKY